MKLTWTDQEALYKALVGLTDAATLTAGKRDMITGSAIFMSRLNREVNRHTRFTTITSGQQYYQSPEDAFMIKEIVINTGNWTPPLEQIPDEFAWRMMNMLSVSGIPTHFFVRGRNEFGLYPIPSYTLTNGIELVFAPRATMMTEEDFTTGTVTVANGSNIITHSATGFTQKMANLGLWFQVTDGSDENWYQITGYTDSSHLTLEQDFQGISNSTVPFRIGQVMDLPEEYLEAPVDYAVHRFYKKRGVIGLQQHQDALNDFNTALQAAKDTYGQASESQVVNAEPRFRTYNPFRGDPPPSISA